MTINEDSISPQSPSFSSSCYNDQVQSIATKLKAVIDDYNINYLANAKELILKLAILLDEIKQGEQRSQVCRKVKEMLADEILEGKITTMWIEKSLPQEYKRKHNKINNNNNVKSEHCLILRLNGKIEQKCDNTKHRIFRPQYNLIIKAMAKSTGFCFVEFDKRGTLIDAKPEEPGWRYQTDKERQ
jgi:hypothetical protein